MVLGNVTLQPGNPREELVYFIEDSTIAGGTLCSLFNQEIAKLADAVVLLEEELIKEEDWNLKWKEHFRPVPLGKSLMVIAPWMEHQPDSERLPLIIDPGQGFGTGHHPSTALAVEMLEIYLDKLDHKPNRLLDVGSGSGILAIVACLLGIDKTYALDHDPNVLVEIRRNAGLNHLESRILLFRANKACLTAPVSLVICNMLLEELRGMAGELAGATAEEGNLICSGLRVEQVPELEKEFIKLGMQQSGRLNRDGWSAVMFRY